MFSPEYVHRSDLLYYRIDRQIIQNMPFVIFNINMIF